MKCQRKALAVGGVLGGEVLGAVLAHDLDPGLGQHGHVLEDTYFVAATTVTAGPSSSSAR